jgi:hypothetical protein
MHKNPVAVFTRNSSFGNRHTAVCALSAVGIYSVEVATNRVQCSDRPCSHLYSAALQCHSVQEFVLLLLLWKTVSVYYVYIAEQSELCL